MCPKPVNWLNVPLPWHTSQSLKRHFPRCSALHEKSGNETPYPRVSVYAIHGQSGRRGACSGHGNETPYPRVSVYAIHGQSGRRDVCSGHREMYNCGREVWHGWYSLHRQHGYTLPYLASCTCKNIVVLVAQPSNLLHTIHSSVLYYIECGLVLSPINPLPTNDAYRHHGCTHFFHKPI